MENNWAQNKQVIGYATNTVYLKSNPYVTFATYRIHLSYMKNAKNRDKKKRKQTLTNRLYQEWLSENL